MDKRINDELIGTMIPALSELARLIGSGVQPDRETLKNILLKIGVGKNESALDEFTHWCQQLILAQSSKETKETIISILQNRGIPEAPAILAVEYARSSPIMGRNDPGEAANTTILSDATVYNRPMLKLRSPSVGDAWIIGSYTTITWSCENLYGKIRIELLSADKSYLVLTETAEPGLNNYGSFHWKVRPFDARNRYSIRLTSTVDSSINDLSDYFTICSEK